MNVCACIHLTIQNLLEKKSCTTEKKFQAQSLLTHLSAALSKCCSLLVESLSVIGFTDLLAPPNEDTLSKSCKHSTRQGLQKFIYTLTPSPLHTNTCTHMHTHTFASCPASCVISAASNVCESSESDKATGTVEATSLLSLMKGDR